jgi:hypothetical protein
VIDLPPVDLLVDIFLIRQLVDSRPPVILQTNRPLKVRASNWRCQLWRHTS